MDTGDATCQQKCHAAQARSFQDVPPMEIDGHTFRIKCMSCTMFFFRKAISVCMPSPLPQHFCLVGLDLLQEGNGSHSAHSLFEFLHLCRVETNRSDLWLSIAVCLELPM